MKMSGVFVAGFKIAAIQIAVLNAQHHHWLAFTPIAYAELNIRPPATEFKVPLEAPRNLGIMPILRLFVYIGWLCISSWQGHFKKKLS